LWSRPFLKSSPIEAEQQEGAPAIWKKSRANAQERRYRANWRRIDRAWMEGARSILSGKVPAGPRQRAAAAESGWKRHIRSPQRETSMPTNIEKLAEELNALIRYDPMMLECDEAVISQTPGESCLSLQSFIENATVRFDFDEILPYDPSGLPGTTSD